MPSVLVIVENNYFILEETEDVEVAIVDRSLKPYTTKEDAMNYVPHTKEFEELVAKTNLVEGKDFEWSIPNEGSY